MLLDGVSWTWQIRRTWLGVELSSHIFRSRAYTEDSERAVTPVMQLAIDIGISKHVLLKTFEYFELVI